MTGKYILNAVAVVSLTNLIYYKTEYINDQKQKVRLT